MVQNMHFYMKYLTYPTVTSKILLPTELETAISPKPFLATITLVIRSGILVPAARKVSPITSGGICIVSPAMFAHQTIKYEYAAIQKIDPIKVIAKNFLPKRSKFYYFYINNVIYI
jgi:hypothetical protein